MRLLNLKIVFRNLPAQRAVISVTGGMVFTFRSSQLTASFSVGSSYKTNHPGKPQDYNSPGGHSNHLGSHERRKYFEKVFNLSLSPNSDGNLPVIIQKIEK